MKEQMINDDVLMEHLGKRFETKDEDNDEPDQLYGLNPEDQPELYLMQKSLQKISDQVLNLEHEIDTLLSS